jgi:hypothetical protein
LLFQIVNKKKHFLIVLLRIGDIIKKRLRKELANYDEDDDDDVPVQLEHCA